MIGVTNEDGYVAEDARYLRLTLGLVLVTDLWCSFYASTEARGLYHDGVFYVFRVVQLEWFSLTGTARTTVQILRQIPIVVLTRFTSLRPFQLGQVFTFTLLILPTVLCALCWFIAPRNRKAWILFPVAYLLIGFAATAMHAIGEASIAASYFWILLFLLLFRTRSIGSQVLFWLLSILAFRLHEGAFLLTCVLLWGCALRWRSAADRRERLFAGLAALLFVSIFAYQIRWMIYPEFPGDMDAIVQGLTYFHFIYFEDHFNLPLVTGTVALLALAIVFFIYFTRPPERAAIEVRAAVAIWVLFAFTAIAVAIMSERSFSPFAQLEARYQPVFVSAALGTAMILLLAFKVPDRIWMQPATIIILITLCLAQTTADIVATRRWNGFVADLQLWLGSRHGLIPWETIAHTGNKQRDIDWRLMAAEWTIPFTSIVFAPTNSIQSMIDLPVGMTYRPLDPEKPDRLPNLRGIDFTPYREALAAQKAGVRP